MLPAFGIDRLYPECAAIRQTPQYNCMPTAAKSAVGPDDPDAIDRARRACLATSLLEPVSQAAQHRAADAEEAVAARQAGGDMPLVGEVAGVDLKPPGAGLVADHGVEQG